MRAGISAVAFLRWLVAPADADVGRAQATAAAFLRVLLGLMWLYNVVWKRPPDFGREADNGLYHFTAYAVSHPVLAPFSWFVEQVVLPNIMLFGWAVLAVETALAVMLLTGAWVRVAAALGAAQSLAIALSVAFAPNEWPWAYWLMIGAHAAVLFSSAGRVFAVDAVRSGAGSARRLGWIWGAIAVAVGGFSVLGSAAEPLADRGTGLVSTDLSLSLGHYNLFGGLLLVFLGGLVLLAARTGSTWLGAVAALVGVAAALSVHAQLGTTDRLLGGTQTSAAFLLSIALVAVTVGRAPGRASPRL